MILVGQFEMWIDDMPDKLQPRFGIRVLHRTHVLPWRFQRHKCRHELRASVCAIYLERR